VAVGSRGSTRGVKHLSSPPFDRAFVTVVQRAFEPSFEPSFDPSFDRRSIVVRSGAAALRPARRSGLDASSGRAAGEPPVPCRPCLS
jgi:hypothetical protein